MSSARSRPSRWTFWIIKILATTLGETGGDTLSMTFDWGYLLSSALFLAILVALGIAQIAAKKFRPSPLLGDDHRLFLLRQYC
ncbi:MAG: hypothetical protein WDM81_17415 [Rhizomicrobium sp.]